MDKKKRLTNIAILTAISLTVSLALYIPDLLSQFENKIFDLFSRHLNPPRATERIVIIEVDQNSIEAESQAGIQWPWPRQLYGPILEFLSEAEAVFIDILFTEPSSYGQEDDQILSRAIKKAGNVYLPFFLSRTIKEVSPEEVDFLSRFALKGAGPARLRYESLITPIDILRGPVRGAGNVAISPDSGDVYRKIPLLFTLKELTLPNLTFSYFTGQGQARVVGETVQVNGVELPLIEGKILLRYFRGKNPFQAFSAEDILEAYRGRKHPNRLNKDFFKGKIVFIGLTAAGLYDLKPTPVSGVATGLSAGVHIHATFFENLINKTYMRPIGSPLMIPFLAVLVLFIVSFVLTHPSILGNLVLFVGTSGVIMGLGGFLFSKTLYLPTLYAQSALIISFILSAAFSYASEGKERLFIKRTFSQYMDKTIVEYVLKNPDLIQPGGKKSWVTVLFADIAGFTTISEKLPPEETARLLHTILDALTEVVVDEQGVVDKYIGDCIMAFWGAPLKTRDDETNACRAALRFSTAIEQINIRFQSQGLAPVAIRVGLHTGDAIAGNMGSTRLFDYTVIGDTVNLTSRLESINKVFNTKIICTQQTLEKTRPRFFARDLGLVQVKGKTEPVPIFELLAENEGQDPQGKEKIDQFHEALSLYRQQEFEKALKRFELLIDRYPDDGPSLFYRKQCESLAANFSLTKDWEVIKMVDK